MLSQLGGFIFSKDLHFMALGARLAPRAQLNTPALAIQPLEGDQVSRRKYLRNQVDLVKEGDSFVSLIMSSRPLSTYRSRTLQ